MKNSIFLIAKKEYLKIVRKPSFWIMILIVPILYLVLAAISGMSTESVQKKAEEEVKEAKAILVVDEAGLINDELILGVFQRHGDAKVAKEKAKDGEVDAAFVYPEDIRESKTIQVFAQETSFVSRGRFDYFAQNLLKQSILQEIEDPVKIALFSEDLNLATTLYKEGKEVDQRFEFFIVPIASVIIYFLLVMFSSSFMLSSVSEEKENRMIETILSIVKPRQLIWGKIAGLTAVSFTQFFALAALMIVIILVSTNIFPIEIDWSAIDVSIWQVITAIFYIITGFLFLSSIMVGVGAAMPKYREAQQFSAIFIILSIFPIYFGAILIADPGGTVARIVSYTPFTAPLILLFRSSVDALPIWESVIGMIVVVLYVGIGLYLAFKLFEIGSLELSKKISFKSVFQKQKRL